jgi:glycosidase
MPSQQARLLDPVASLDSDGQVYDIDGDLVPRRYRFDPDDAACLSRLEESVVRFRLVTEPDVTEARVTVTDNDVRVHSHAMDLELGGADLKVWSKTLEVEDGDLYTLALLDHRGRAVYLTRAGIAGSVERLDRWQIDLGAIPLLDIPTWTQGAMMYQIFPDRFANGDPGNDPVDIEPWDTAPTRAGFKGGDLDGIVEHLDYLVGLGTEVIYLNPVVSAPSNHRYDASDFHHVDPILGGDEAFDRFRGATAERDIKLVVDLSLNHCHPTHETFADVRDRGEDSPYWGWFQIVEWPVHVRYRPEHRTSRFAHFGEEEAANLEAQTGIPLVRLDEQGRFLEPTYDTWYGVPTMPRFDLTNLEARQYLLDVTKHWVTRFGADGFRMDVARYIELDFWRECRAQLRRVQDDAYLLCEIVGDAAAWLQGDTFDGTMNYVGRKLILGFCSGQLSGAEWSVGMERLVASLTPESLQASQLLLGSHDTPRFLTAVGGERWRLHLGTLLQFTLPGLPSVYYGDEVYAEGGGDPACRAGFPWGEEAKSPLVDAIRELSALRRGSSALRHGDWQPGEAGDDWVSYLRRHHGDEVLVIVNRGSEPVEAEVDGRLPIWGEAEPAGTGVVVAPASGAILARLS